MRIRLMLRQDIPEGMRLKDDAHWNQTTADWEMFLSANPEGCFVAEVDGQVVGTTTTMAYQERFAWIGMVLVDSHFRNRGIGRALLETAIEHLDSQSLSCIKLDATPQGMTVYEKFGFVTEYEIERWTLNKNGASFPSNSAIPEWEDTLELDRAVFGADRGRLLRAISKSAPEFAQAQFTPGGLAGFAFGRHGSHSDHLGPWVAREPEAAARMLDSFLARAPGESVIVDCPKSNPQAAALVKSHRFKISRPLTRMVRGVNAFPGRPEFVYGILGPEFG